LHRLGKLKQNAVDFWLKTFMTANINQLFEDVDDFMRGLSDIIDAATDNNNVGRV
jgi:hypothetical protein